MPLFSHPNQLPPAINDLPPDFLGVDPGRVAAAAAQSRNSGDILEIINELDAQPAITDGLVVLDNPYETRDTKGHATFGAAIGYTLLKESSAAFPYVDRAIIKSSTKNTVFDVAATELQAIRRETFTESPGVTPVGEGVSAMWTHRLATEAILGRAGLMPIFDEAIRKVEGLGNRQLRLADVRHGGSIMALRFAQIAYTAGNELTE